MQNQQIYFGNSLLQPNSKTISETTVTIHDETFFALKNYDCMDPFFMTIVSNSDLWMFISSTGGLTCGRQNAESALFPYYTDDKIHDSNETTGSHTILLVEKQDKQYLWKPFSMHTSNVYNITRTLFKNSLGNKIKFEEVNHDLSLSYAYTWKSCDQFGFVKESCLVNFSEEVRKVKVVDGIRNLLPYGVNTLLQTTRSTLVDGYKRCELVPEVDLGIYTLSSILTDKAEPSESLKATTVWSKGCTQPVILLSEQHITDFCNDQEVLEEIDIKGRRGAYYIKDMLELSGHSQREWYIVAELNQSATDIEKLKHQLAQGDTIVNSLKVDIMAGDNNLKQLVYEADGFQFTAKDKAGYRHFSNTLFNIMRGGIYGDGYTINTIDFVEFVKKWNENLVSKHREFLDQLPESINYSALKETVSVLADADLLRLVYEYLPLTYSRRHGDPSRPWNKFNIDIAKEDGSKKLKYEGNWRDIFQNWEALSVSFPGYIESIITKFVNASTADGYNPYRITNDGIDWEVLDPEDPWSNIGYWGDHQLIYLLKLLELSESYTSEELRALLVKEIFVYANVPYRIKGFEELKHDPRNSIVFDYELDESIHKKVSLIGSDGKLLANGNEIYKVTLMEKLLVTILSKFSNYVPEGGIWMNTQRPEWNDANNALVGNGLSMVTLYYLHRFQKYMAHCVEETKVDTYRVSMEVVQLFHQIKAVLEKTTHSLEQGLTDEERFNVVESLGKMGEAYRESIYNHGFKGEKVELTKEDLQSFITLSMEHLQASIKKNRREDGLYHAYNLIEFGAKSCKLSYLYEMLEGQVAVLSSKALENEEIVNVLESLRRSQLYREDQLSYMLYPNRELPKFLEKNILPEDKVNASLILQKEVEKGWNRFVEKDIQGKYHFNGHFRNKEELEAAIEKTQEYCVEDIKVAGEIFSNLFNHHGFTGRSGTFYKYEGLGSIYWHMVSKLLLTVQENFIASYNEKGLSDVAESLKNAYEAIKVGIGLEKSPKNYGAFTTDPYSHTPGFAGVQQPGMTGQVKEDFISRLGELGVCVKEGKITFEPLLLDATEYLNEPVLWKIPSSETKHKTEEKSNEFREIELTVDSLGFTFCAVPIVYQLKGEKKIVVDYHDGTQWVGDNTHTLTSDISQKVFKRDTTIKQIHVYGIKKTL